MRTSIAVDEALLQRLPLPLAQLYRRAHNAKNALDRHLAAFYLWEAALKLLGCVAVAAYADSGDRDDDLAECLQNLARPSLGHWWEFVRRLTPVMADGGDSGFACVREVLLGRTRDDLPRVAGLDSVLREVLDGQGGGRTTVRLTELFDRLVRYRNQELGHGAAGQKDTAHYDRVGRALLAGVPQLLEQLDVLAGRRLIHVEDVRLRSSGQWLIERYELRGETAHRLESLELPDSAGGVLPGRMHVEMAGTLRPLHPLAIYDEERGEVLFLNARRGKKRIEYLSYNSGRFLEREGLEGERRELLGRVLKVQVSDSQIHAWAEHSRAEEAPIAVEETKTQRRLGEFELLSELGRGGMGVVFRAWQPSLGRQVALKKLFQTGDPKAEKRFEREIRALGRVEHPHLIKIFTSGSDGDDWFYAMELVEGAPLADVCEQLSRDGIHPGTIDGAAWQQAASTACETARKAEKLLGQTHQPPKPAATLPPASSASYVRQVVDLVRQVAEAAHALHEHGVIHRDVKPGNILVTAAGTEAVLMDLGLAQVADEVQGKLTRTRQFVGTLRYASPEQVLAVRQLDRRSDVYSLGATLWELLTLRPLFGATDSMPTPDLMEKIQREEVERPSRYHKGLSRDLEAIVLKCLDKDAKRRYATAAELAGDLSRWQAGEPVTARQVTGLERAWKWVKRRPVLAAMAAAVVVALLGGTAVSTWFGIQANNRADELEQKQQRLEQEQKRRALAQVQALLTAAPAAVLPILADLENSREDVLPHLRELYAQETDAGKRMRLALALLREEPDRVRDGLVAWMLKVDDPAEVVLIRDALADHASALKVDLWQRANNKRTAGHERFRALVALAAFDSDGPGWRKAGRSAVDELLAANSLHLGTWVAALKPVAQKLLPHLGDVFRDAQSEHKQAAAQVLTDYARNQPDLLAELLLNADAKQYAVLKPVLARHHEEAAARMRQELVRLPDYWKDGPLDPAWKTPAEALRREVEQAEGLFSERWALCQKLPLARLLAVTEALRPCGYRPVRVRPWSTSPLAPAAPGRPGEPSRAGSAARLAAPTVAIVWTRDGRDWRLETGRTAAEARDDQQRQKKAGFIPADVAGYRSADGDRLFACLWVKAGKDEQAVLYAGVPAEKHKAHNDTLVKDGFIPSTVQGLHGPGSKVQFAGVWCKGPGKPEKGNVTGDDNEPAHAVKVIAGEQLLADVDVGPAAPPQPLRQRALADLAVADNALRDKPDDFNQHYWRGLALYQLGRDAEALAAFDAYLKRGTAASAWRYRALVNARLGRAEQARRDLAEFLKRSNEPSLQTAVAALVAVHLGDEITGLQRLSRLLEASPTDATLAFNAACVYAQASRVASVGQFARAAGLVGWPRSFAVLALPLPPAERSANRARRAITLLRQALANGFTEPGRMQTEADLEPLWELPGYRRVLAEASLLRRYASVWHENAALDAEGLHGLSPQAHLERCRALATRGYRPTALSLASVPGDGIVAASVWHRRVLLPEDGERHARRQASAAATALHLGQLRDAWPLFQHRPDPTARSYLVHRARLLGVDPRLLVERLGEKPNVSARRALIVALGEYTDKELPLKVRRPLVEKLLAWYHDDPDPGIHGAIDWLLRHAKEGPAKRPLDWGQARELERVDGTLKRRDPDGKRLWYVNGQGQTFALVKGPVQFRMGSPPSEPYRYPGEKPHLRVIGRNFALATKPVTVTQFQQFLAEHPFEKRYSPEAGGPIIRVSWFATAQYCNWLSKKEGIPKKEWCYPDEIEAGMKLFPDYLKRTGYRLPTEAEWEFACRAGTITERYYGVGQELQPRYAFYLDNSQNRTWPVGQKRPNDLGLFDMHGNVWTWCQDQGFYYPSGRVEDKEDIRESKIRVLRGASFFNFAAVVRSAIRNVSEPGSHSYNIGLRVCRTYH